MKHRTLFGRPLGIGLILLQKTLWGSVLLVVGSNWPDKTTQRMRCWISVFGTETFTL